MKNAKSELKIRHRGALKKSPQEECHNNLRIVPNVSIASSLDSIVGSVHSNMETIRVIFLDVDGVLNHPNHTDEVTTVCPSCVGKLKTMIEQTSAKIVLSSTWRLNKLHRDTLFRYLRAFELDQGVVVGETRDLRGTGKTRAEEINDWLSDPNLYRSRYSISSLNLWWFVSSWVSLDDLDLARMQPIKAAKCKHIKLNPKLGLCGTENIVLRVAQRLVPDFRPGESKAMISSSSAFLDDGWKSIFATLDLKRQSSYESSDVEMQDSTFNMLEPEGEQKRRRTMSRLTYLSDGKSCGSSAFLKPPPDGRTIAL